MLLQSLLMKSVEDVDDGSWEDWEPEYEEEEEPIVVKRGPRRKKKKQLVEPYDWGEPEESDSYDAFDEQKDWSDEPEEEVPYEETVETVSYTHLHHNRLCRTFLLADAAALAQQRVDYRHPRATVDRSFRAILFA